MADAPPQESSGRKSAEQPNKGDHSNQSAPSDRTQTGDDSLEPKNEHIRPLSDIQNLSRDIPDTPQLQTQIHKTLASYTNQASRQQTTPKASLEQQLQRLNRDLESMVIKYAKSERENLQNKNKVDELDKKLKRALKDNDSLANRIKLLMNDKNQLTDTLNAKLAQLTVLEQKNLSLNSVQDVKLKECEERISQLENINENLLKQIESYKSKEGELLDFSERLSMKHMLLQTELDKALHNCPDYKLQYEQVARERDELVGRTNELTKELDSLRDAVQGERALKERFENEKDEAEAKYQKSLDEFQNELKVVRRKHQINSRELLKQYKQLQAELNGRGGSEVKKGETM